MTLTIQEIVDGFKNKRDWTYRRLVCLRNARRGICFDDLNIPCSDLNEPQNKEFFDCQKKGMDAIDRMAALITFGSDAGCAPNPHQELRDHLAMVLHKNEALEGSERHWNPQRITDWMNEAIGLLDKID